MSTIAFMPSPGTVKRSALLGLLATLLVLFAVGSESASAVTAGTLIKGSGPAVYYYATDGRRHAFPNEQTYFSWYSDFSGVTVVSDSVLASIKLGSNITYHPGVRLVKIKTDPKVYAVGPGGTLHWVQNEVVAKTLYGADWNKKVDDVDEAFFVNYRIDTPIAIPDDFDLVGAQRVSSINDDLSIVIASLAANRLRDPGFEFSTSDFIAQKTTDSSLWTGRSPIAGTHSLVVSMNSDGGSVVWMTVPGTTNAKASTLFASAVFRGETVRPDSTLQFCAGVTYVGNGTLIQKCVDVSKTGGAVTTVAAALDLDATRALEKLYIRLVLKGPGPVKYTVDTAAARLNIPGVIAPPTVAVSCSEDTWTCGAYNGCTSNGSQTRTCAMTQDCTSVVTPSPPTTVSCTPPPTGTAPKIGNCQIFPSDNPWNTDISNYPVNANSAAYIATIGAASKLHPDFGSDPSYGIPYDVVVGSQAKVPITFTAYGDESDPGPYPIPPNAKVEAGGDAHVLVVDKDACVLYELYVAEKNSTGWNADSGAVFDLKSNALRPEGWTSADAAGLPVFAGLVRYDEVKAGAINHAIRFTTEPSQAAHIHPATHDASSSTNAGYPPMGLRVRLKQSYDISGFTGDARVILEAMKRYGMILADNGGDWFFQGDSNPGWNDTNLDSLKNVPGSAFEAVETGPLIK